MIKNLSENNPLGLELRPIRQNQFTVAGNPAWKIEGFLGPEASPLFYFFDAFRITNGKEYHIIYGEKPLKVPETLPVVNKKLNSFHFFKPIVNESTYISTYNHTLDYKSLHERSREPKSFTQKDQEMIYTQCHKMKDNYRSISFEDRLWFLLNC